MSNIFKKRSIRKIVSVILVALLVVGLCPVQDFAVKAEEAEPAPAPDKYTRVDGIKSLSLNGNEVNIISKSDHQLRIRFLTDDVVRIQMEVKGNTFTEDPEPAYNHDNETLIRNKQDSQYPGGKVSVEENETEYIMSTSKLKLTIHKADSLMKLEDKQTGKVLWEEAKPLGWLDGKTVQTLKTDDKEYFYGGGQQNGYFSHKGTITQIVNNNKWDDKGVSCPVPFYVSTRGYGVLRHTFSEGKYDFGATNGETVETQHSEERFDAYYFAGGSIPDVLDQYTDLTGKPCLYPYFAYYLGRTGCLNQDPYSSKDDMQPADMFELGTELFEDGYVKYDMPLGWNNPNDRYGCGYGHEDTQQGNLDNLKRFVEFSKQYGVVTGLWTEEDLYPEDPDNPKPNERNIDLEVGYAGSRIVKTDVAWVGPGYSFGLNSQRVAAEGIERNSGDRAFVITLDGWAGTQRYGGLWSGDQTGGNWEYIRMHIPTYIGAGLSGIPNVGSDMDGIFGGGNGEIQSRDYQWKTFTPLQLDMDSWWTYKTNQKKPWWYGEPYTSINRMYIKLKTEMMPYTYSLAKEASDTAMPMVRAMVLEYPEDSYTYDKKTQYQYMYGPNLLVAPVYDEDENANEKRDDIYLPDSNQVWIDYFTGDQYEGGQVLNGFDAPIWKLPVFVKNGAIIPMTVENNTPMRDVANENIKNLDGDEPRIFDVYPSGETEFTLYEDDGHSQAYKKENAYATTKITSKAPVSGTGQAVITVEPAVMGNAAKSFADLSYANERETQFIVNVQKKPAELKAAIGGAPVSLKEVSSMKEFENGVNVYFYDETPDLNKYATVGSEFENTKIITSPKLYVKIEKTNNEKNSVVLTIDGFNNTQPHKENTLSVPANASGLNVDGVSYDSADLSWSTVEGTGKIVLVDNGEAYFDDSQNLQDAYADGQTTDAEFVKTRSLNKLDLSNSHSLSAVVTGDGSKNSLVFGIKDKNGNLWKGSYVLDGKGTETVTIPWDQFTCDTAGAARDFSEVSEFTISIRKNSGSALSKGSVWLDDICALTDDIIPAAYDLKISSGQESYIVSNLDQGQYTAKLLKPATEYRVSVRSSNQRGANAWSEAVSFTTEAKPDPYRDAVKVKSIQATNQDGTPVADQPGNEIELAIDGDNYTRWHTLYGRNQVGCKIEMDMGEAYELAQFEYVPRDDRGNGTITNATVEYSMDGVHWAMAADKAEWQVDGRPKYVDMKGVCARYLRVTVNDTSNHVPVSADEFRPYKVSGTQGFPVGDTNPVDYKVDEIDFNQFSQHTGVKMGDTTWKQIDKADINLNQIIDAYDAAYVRRVIDGYNGEAAVVPKGNLSLNFLGEAGTVTSKSFKAGDKILIEVQGGGLEDVFAIGLKLPFDKGKVTCTDFQCTQKPILLDGDIGDGNMVNDSVRKDDYAMISLISKDAAAPINGTVKIGTIRLQALENTTVELKPEDIMLISRDLQVAGSSGDSETPGPKPIYTYPANSIDLNGASITVTSDSHNNDDGSHTVPDAEPMSNALDGNFMTRWDTKYGADLVPAAVTFDLGRKYAIDEFTYIPRQDVNGGNGTVLEADLEFSNDNFVTVATGSSITFDYTGENQYKQVQTVKLDAPVEARYVRLTVNDVYTKGFKIVTAAEFVICGDPVARTAGGNEKPQALEEFTPQIDEKQKEALWGTVARLESVYGYESSPAMVQNVSQSRLTGKGMELLLDTANVSGGSYSICVNYSFAGGSNEGSSENGSGGSGSGSGGINSETIPDTIVETNVYAPSGEAGGYKAPARVETTKKGNEALVFVTIDNGSVLKEAEGRDKPLELAIPVGTEEINRLLSESAVSKANIFLVVDSRILESKNINLSSLPLAQGTVKALQDTGKSLSFCLKNQEGSMLYQWDLDGKQMKAGGMQPETMNLALDLVPTENISSIHKLLTVNKKTNSGLCINLLETKDFPNGTSVKVKVADGKNFNPGKIVYTYRYDEPGNKFNSLPVVKRKIDNNGMVTLNVVYSGKYVILPSAADKSSAVTLTNQVKLPKNLKGEKGETISLKAQLPKVLKLVDSMDPAGIKSYGKEVMPAMVTYKAQDPSIASVTKNGKVTMKKNGKTVIATTLTLKNGNKKTFKTTVEISSK